MPRLDLRTRERIVTLKQQGHIYKAIQQRLEEEGITVTIKTLYLLVTKYIRTNTVVDRPRSKRPRILNDQHYKAIDNALRNNDELTTRQLHSLLTHEWPSLSVSLSTVKRARHDLGWVVSSPKYCQMIRETNKEKRLAWCQKMISEGEQFENVIFTDECSVMLETHRKRCYRRKDDPRKLKPHLSIQ